jgi:uncharacterized membrane protein
MAMADLIMLTFDDPYGAVQALSAARALEELRYAWIDDVAVVEKHRTGVVTLHTPHGSAARGALFGGLIGLLLFWWFPPAWFFGGWLGGLGGGALIGEAMKHSGIDEWAWHGLTDIHEEAQSAGKDVHHGDHGTEQAP